MTTATAKAFNLSQVRSPFVLKGTRGVGCSSARGACGAPPGRLVNAGDCGSVGAIKEGGVAKTGKGLLETHARLLGRVRVRRG